MRMRRVDVIHGWEQAGPDIARSNPTWGMMFDHTLTCLIFSCLTGNGGARGGTRCL